MLVATEFRLLGAVEVRVDGRAVDVGHLRQRCVLAVLLVEANRPVPAGELARRVWGEHALQRVRETLYGYLSRLRTALAPAAGVRIARRPAGYLLAVDPDAVDVHRFHRLSAEARAARDCGVALALFQEALGLWRGEALAGLDTPWLAGVRATLDRARLAVELDRNDAALRAGRHAQLLDEMSAAAAAYPLDERLAAQLMLALYRAGRPDDALARYERLRTRLADESGADPGAPLRELHQRIQCADPSLPAEPSIVELTGAPVPRQVPAPPCAFTGRAAELAELSGPAAIRAIVGPGGIGKTWLAQRWAYDHRARYPDGQLYVDLHGFDPAGPPVPPSAAVRGFLDALGVAPAAVPADPVARVALYRGLVADKRLLIVLDNARDSAQVIPLLPGSGGCTVLVTSRHQLGGLVTAHGARPLTLGLLAEPQAHQLLAGHLGDRRIAAEPQAVAAVLRHCAGLPLALGIVAARAAVHPDLPLAALAAELGEAATRLDALDAGEVAVNLRAVLSCSTGSLPPPAARLFALLGVAPGADVSPAAAASLAGLPVPATRVLLRQLAAAHLVGEPAPGRYRLHDLVRLYASEQAAALDGRSAAVHRVLDHYLHTGYAADRLLHPFRDPIDLAPPGPGVLVPAIADHEHALAWFTAEHANLVAAVDQAAGAGLDGHVWRLAWTLATYLDRRARWQDRAAVHAAALAAARRLDDRSAQAYALRGVAQAEIRLGRYDEARARLRHALGLFGDLGDVTDPVGQAHTYRTLARTYARADRPAQALPHDERALELYRAAGHRSGQAVVLNAIGWHHAHLDAYELALPCCEQALALHQESGDQHGAAITLDSLGFIHRRLGQHDRAIACYRLALDLFEQVGDRYEKADTLVSLGDAYDAAGRPGPARSAWSRALVMLDELSVPSAQLRARLAADPGSAPASSSRSGSGPYPGHVVLRR